ncbi:MAG: hypothetical protein ABWJ42_03275 [Sulfolobales archaeon]
MKRERSNYSNKDDPEEFIEIYGEYISLRELGLATLLSTIGAFTLYSATPYIASMLNLTTLVSALKITLGAVGATIGFIFSIPLTRVKRSIVEEK